jgi:hypothetical protein
VEAESADETGEGTVLGGMADEAGGFVDHQEVIIFMDDGQAGREEVGWHEGVGGG